MSADWDNIDLEEETQPEGTQGKEEITVKEVKMSKVKVGALILGAVIAAIILILSVRGASVEKVESGGENSEPVQTQQVNQQQSSTNTGESNMKNTENSSNNSGVRSGSSSNSNSAEKTVGDLEDDSTVEEIFNIPEEKKTSNKVEVEQKSQDELKEEEEEEEDDGETFSMVQVNEPVLGEARETSAMVVSKEAYKINGNAYIYCVNLMVLLSENNTRDVPFYCPRQTYDALVSGDTVFVNYQVDTDGSISISSLQR